VIAQGRERITGGRFTFSVRRRRDGETAVLELNDRAAGEPWRCSPWPRGTRDRAGTVLWLAVVVTLWPQATRAQYVESFQAWSATSADTWETKDLSGAPFNVPADAVVEIAVRNADAAGQRWGGGRSAGSSLDRRFLLHNAESGGTEVVVLHVQADGSSQIEHYSDDTADVTFVLLGHWDRGTYVEALDTFSAGASASWQDVNLSTYGVGAEQVAEVVLVNATDIGARQAGVRTNGSAVARIVDLHRNKDFGDDLATMFVQADGTASATVEAYAEVDADVAFVHVGYWSTPPGAFSERLVDLGSPTTDATWQDLNLSGSVPAFAVAEISLANSAVTTEVLMGVRSNGSALSRVLNLTEAETGINDGSADFGRMHVSTDGSSLIEFYHDSVASDHQFLLTGYWKPTLSDHGAGQERDAFTESGGETDAELFGFSLTPVAPFTVTQLVFRLTNLNGLTDGDWAGVEIVVDDDISGDIDPGEATTVGGSGVVNQAAGTITFSTSIAVNVETHYILRADFASLSDGDTVTLDLDKDDVTTAAEVNGGTTAAVHRERCADYHPRFTAWTAGSADTWETKDLSGAPFNVPADAVVEVAVRNSALNAERSGGVRAVGSSLERRFLLREAEGELGSNGVDVVVIQVQTDASSRIEHYADDVSDVDFVLLGYWACGTYVESFETFTAGASATWQDLDLCTYGIGPEYVAELVITNDDTVNAREAGARTNGSSLERRVDVHDAQFGGVDAVTLFVKADATAGAAVELYAEDDADIDFYLVGYWSTPPGAYTELFADGGSPAVDATWENLDLTSLGVPDNAVAEFVLANEYGPDENSMGVRANTSSLARVLELQEAEGGGSDLARLNVRADETATIEFYHEDVSDAHTFHSMGYWNTCDASISYTISDLGALTAGASSVGRQINAYSKVAGFDEDAGGDASAWFSDCGTLTSLGTLGGSNAEAQGINDNDLIVGWAHNGSGARRAFTWTSGGGMTDLGAVSGRSDSEAHAVNASGEVVGTVVDVGVPPGRRLAFLYLPAPAYTLPAGMNSLGTLGGLQSVAMDINDSGRVVGGAQNGTGPKLRYMRPFRWQNGTMTDLGTLGGESESTLHRAEGVNNSGNVVGASFTAGGNLHGFFWNGSMTDLGVLTGGTTSMALAINDTDEVVGTSNVAGGAFHAFIWDSSNGRRDLNDLIDPASGWTLTRAKDINDDGRITGWGTNGTGDVRAFLLTPSCSAGGGAARSDDPPGALAVSGSGLTDQEGLFEAVVVSPDDESLAEIVIEAAPAGEIVEYEVGEPGDGSAGRPGPGAGTLAGFADGVGLSRSLLVTSSASAGTFKATISLVARLDDIGEVGPTPDDLELHVLDPTQGPPPGTWITAGTNLGESGPGGVLGESGFVVYPDGSVHYWVVRDELGTFAVGRGVASNDDEPLPNRPLRRSTVCGLGLLGPLMIFSMMFLVRWSRRRFRRTTS